jgi:hypothetical protein
MGVRLVKGTRWASAAPEGDPAPLPAAPYLTDRLWLLRTPSSSAHSRKTLLARWQPRHHRHSMYWRRGDARIHSARTLARIMATASTHQRSARPQQQSATRTSRSLSPPLHAARHLRRAATTGWRAHADDTASSGSRPLVCSTTSVRNWPSEKQLPTACPLIP